MSNPEVLFVLTNHLETGFAFWLEPPGRRYLVERGERYEVILDGALSEPPTIGRGSTGEIYILCFGNAGVYHRGVPATLNYSGAEP